MNASATSTVLEIKLYNTQQGIYHSFHWEIKIKTQKRSWTRKHKMNTKNYLRKIYLTFSGSTIKNLQQQRLLKEKDFLLFLCRYFEKLLLRICGSNKLSSLTLNSKHPVILIFNRNFKQGTGGDNFRLSELKMISNSFYIDHFVHSFRDFAIVQ